MLYKWYDLQYDLQTANACCDAEKLNLSTVFACSILTDGSITLWRHCRHGERWFCVGGIPIDLGVLFRLCTPSGTPRLYQQPKMDGGTGCLWMRQYELTGQDV